MLVLVSVGFVWTRASVRRYDGRVPTQDPVTPRRDEEAEAVRPLS